MGVFIRLVDPGIASLSEPESTDSAMSGCCPSGWLLYHNGAAPHLASSLMILDVDTGDSFPTPAAQLEFFERVSRRTACHEVEEASVLLVKFSTTVRTAPDVANFLVTFKIDGREMLQAMELWS